MPDRPREMPLQYLKGVGPVRAAQFEALGIRVLGDLLWHLPFRYELLPKSVAIGRLELDKTATVVGQVRRVSTRGGFRKASILAEVEDATGVCAVRWFNAAYLRDQLAPGQIVRLTGKVDADERRALFVNPAFRIVPDDEDPFQDDRDRYQPVYPAAGNLTSSQIAKVVSAALDRGLDHVAEFIPPKLVEKRKLPPRRTAIARLHAPVTLADIQPARRRLAYDELLLMQLAVQRQRRQAREATGAYPVVTTEAIDRRIRARLPFTLTDAQDRAVHAIVADLDSTAPMSRLLQGDVGAGKTAVAVYAALSTVANRLQVAIAAPTEILARQTHAHFARYLEGSRVRTELLVGGMNRGARSDLLARLSAREVDLIVGTHALFERDVRFRALGLVIVDEQHRFGVAQRQSLRRKGHAPHYLVMTATPIPRTLAMTVYGDLDVTTIDALPPGRQPVETRLVGPEDNDAAWAFVREQLATGRRAYVVYPLVEESEALDLKAATAQVEELAGGALAGYRLGLLHGRMRADEKSATFAAFRSGEIQVLVSTTVIEVGVDVPEATVMVIEHAERFGLSQLHQLRGRVGRGTAKSHCLLMSDFAGEKSRERLAVLCATTDGFKIAEADLQIRGPGELAGTRQHGLPLFKAADLLEDFDLLRHARDDAAEIVAADPDLQQPEHAALKHELKRRE